MSEFASRAKASRARLIRKVDEADPLVRQKCNGPMRVIALIDDPAVVRPHLSLALRERFVRLGIRAILT